MTDRELLELAAKAAGIALHSWSEIEQGYRREDGGYFRPLTDDGDALRLAVKLDIPPSSESVNGTTWVCRGEIQIFQPHNGDPYAATRRAIVRAAAAIEEGMK